MPASMDRFTRRIRAVEKLAFKAATTPQLAYSSIEDGAIQSVEDGSLKAIIGKQYDGTQSVNVVNGPVPPTPSVPITIGGQEAIRVRWDGLFVDGAVVPMDFARVEVHISDESDFAAVTATTLYDTIETPRGGELSFSVPADTYFVRLVTRSQSGVASPPSATVSVEATEVQTGPTSAPTDSPALTVHANDNHFWLLTEAIDLYSKLTYHVSTTDGFTPGPGTIAKTDTRSQSVMVTGLPGGGPFVRGTTYYFKVVEYNDLGAAPASSQVSSVLRVFDANDIPDLADVIEDANDAILAAAAAQLDADNALVTYSIEYAVNSSESTAPTTGWSTAQPTRTAGQFIWFRTTVTRGDGTPTTTAAALLTGNTGAAGPAGSAAPGVFLVASTQVLTSPAAGGTTTPATTTVTGSAVNTTITVWEYSVNGGSFSGTPPTGTSRTGNVVTITGSALASTTKTVAVRMADANGVQDIMTVARNFDGAGGAGTVGPAGADAYTVLLTNESHTFPGSTTAALAGSTTSQVIAMKGTVAQSASVGTIQGQVAGQITAAVTNNNTASPTITVTVTTSLTAQSGVLTIPITVDGIVFTQSLSWSVTRTGSQGIQGSPGTNGASLYTWLKYADTPTTGMSDSPTGKTYMGIAYNKTSSTESSTYSDYEWSLIQGTQGIQGPPGTNGQTTYTWVKYATSAAGAGLNDSPTGMTYIGLAFNKTTATESTTPGDYQWSLIQGPQGSQGIQGVPGADGITYYTWLKYANSATPLAGDMSDSPTGKTYMGLAVGKTSPTESTVYTDYNWSLIQGPQGNQGIAGTPGVDGTTTYTWVKYAPNGAPTTGQMVDTPAGMTYIGLAFNKTTATESTDPTQYQWSLIQGATGATGTSITAVTPYWAQVTAGAAAPATPGNVATPPSPWVTPEPAFASNTDLWTTNRITYANPASYAYTTPAKSSTYSGMVPKITVIGTASKLFRDVTSYVNAASNIVGNIVIDTPITFTNRMFKIRVGGFNYSGQGSFNLEIAGYATATPTLQNHSAVNGGILPVGVRLARRISTGTVCVILTSQAANNYWQYPKLMVDAEVSHVTPPDSWATGWTTSLVTEANIATDRDLMVTTPTINTPSDLSRKVQWGTTAPVNGTTFGNVGDTYYVKSGTAPNTQIDAIYEATAQNTWTIRYVQNAAIKDLAVGKITALSTELAKLTGAGHLVDPKPVLAANSPSGGKISWPQFKVKYKEHELTVPANAATGTAARFVVYRWSGTAGSIEETSTTPVLNVGDMILFSNINGVPFRVFGTVLVDGDMVVEGSIGAKSVAADVMVTNDFFTRTGYIGELRAEQIRAGEGLIHELELIGGLRLNVTTAYPEGTMRFNPREGLIVEHPNPDGTASGKQTYIKADGTGSQFIGDAILDTLTLNGGMNLSGSDMRLSGTLKAMDGIDVPTQPVSVSSSHPVNTRGVTQWYDGARPDGTTAYFKGLTDGPGTTEYIVARYGVYGTPYSDLNWGGKADEVGFIEEGIPSGWAAVGGVTRISTTYYALCCARNMTTGAYDYGTWRVYKIAAGGTVTGSFDMTHTASGSRLPIIGNDGASLLIAVVSSDTLFLRTVPTTQTTTVTSTGQLTLGAAGTWNASVTGIMRAPIGGVDRYIATATSNGYVYSVTTPYARVDAETFPLAAGNCRGAFIDTSAGGTIRTLHSDGRIYSYTWLGGTWDVGHSWYGTPRAPSNAEAETPVTKITVTPKRFATWTLSLSEEPPGEDADHLSANAARFYAGPVSFDGLQMRLQDTLTGGVLSKSYTAAWTTSGKQPEIDNGFSERPGGLGVVESSKKNPLNLTDPIWKLSGAGPGNVGRGLAWDEDGVTLRTRMIAARTTSQSITTAGGFVRVSGYTEEIDTAAAFDPATGIYTIPETGYYDISFSSGWSTETTTRRIVALEWFPGAAAGAGTGTTIARDDVNSSGYRAVAISVLDEHFMAGQTVAVAAFSGVQPVSLGTFALPRFSIRKVI